MYESPSKFNVAQLGGLLQRERPSCLLTARLPVVQPSENIAAAGAEEWTLPGNATSSDEPRAAMFGAERRSKRVAETPSNKLLDKKARKEGCMSSRMTPWMPAPSLLTARSWPRWAITTLGLCASFRGWTAPSSKSLAAVTMLLPVPHFAGWKLLSCWTSLRRRRSQTTWELRRRLLPAWSSWKRRISQMTWCWRRLPPWRSWIRRCSQTTWWLLGRLLPS